MKKILLIGGGGHCASVADVLIRTKEYDEIGIVDFAEDASVFGIPIVGCDDDLEQLKADGYGSAFVTVGSVGSTALREKLARKILEIGFAFPNIIDPSAVISESAMLGRGIFVGKRAVINARSRIEDAAIINTGAIVEHDCRIGSFVHVSPGATLCGGVTVGKSSHIGAGSVVIQYLSIGENCVIGAGSTVIRSVEDGKKAVGNPARILFEIRHLNDRHPGGGRNEYSDYCRGRCEP